MNFSHTAEQQSIFDLAEQFLTDGTPQSRLLEIERREGSRFDPELWAKFGAAGLCGLAVPEAYDGGGLGFVGLAGVMERIGQTTAPIPFFETSVLGGLAVAEFGNDAQKKAIPTEVAAGQRILTAALIEVEASSLIPKTHARRVGVKAYVPAAEIADQVLVSATTQEGLAVFIVDARAPGVSLDALATTSRMPESMMQLESVVLESAAMLGAPGQGGEIIEFIELRANAALCSLSLGVCEAALLLTAEYSKTRKQFDQPVAIAKHFASEAGYRMTFSAQHIHGGIGVDREYPVHRYYVYARHLELMLGGSTHQLRRLGKLIAENVA